jgi:hypothetical protein
MVVRITRVLSASVILALLVNVMPAVCDGWSLSNPFSSDTKTQALKQTAPKPVKKEPSALEKLGTGTKNFFSKTGEALGLKKPEPKKPLYATAVARPQTIPSSKKTETKSWLPSMFQPEEPKKPKTVSEWIGNKRLDP